jgi:transcriptional regulator with XRE-family HTH domain
VNSRITFGAELRYAMHVRGLSLTEVARRSGVAIATASSAALGRPVNVNTALRVARAVAAQPVIPELLDWVARPPSSEVGLRRGDSTPQPSTSDSHPASAPDRRIARGRPPRPAATAASGQLRIAMD